MDSDIMHIGGRIRRLRRELKKTLLEVATEANLSVGFLSQVERNLTGISISSLVNVAKALRAPLSALIDQPRQDQPDSHEGSRESYAIRPTQQRYERLSTTFAGSLLNAVKVSMMEGYSSEWVAHAGDEFVFVLSGHVRYTVGKQDYPLGPGDSLHFDAHERHRVVNVGHGPVELIAVGTLPLFGDGQPAFPSLPGERKPPRTRAARKRIEPPPTPSAQQDARHDEAAAPNAVTTHDGAPRAAKKNTR
ncbi:XRE family transcriptional regulator [Burkholderia pseudomallei]|uniref:DNA-binding protein n=7 Tax=pseudomallei group TaxID=111527 RepID=Q3JFT0_BURP1|nr:MULTISPECIES: XRE family transcriptional regulator [Burkholderia]AAU46861.1 DNA-binding protein [Burkholderia mallei ATCC 23344]ABA51588.1 DNA-binding protein [Burkholderia pseudomallei 1710b]ABO02808.1 DNA-binding protein [Burkholderia mallei NCTC 10247]AGZ30480.1 helix-turn-helix family protein [Burkholderia pseudomallei NCTC 13179]AIO53754.1 helix-turn-helix family protein [Burkholderia mallei]